MIGQRRLPGIGSFTDGILRKLGAFGGFMPADDACVGDAGESGAVDDAGELGDAGAPLEATLLTALPTAFPAAFTAAPATAPAAAPAAAWPIAPGDGIATGAIEATVIAPLDSRPPNAPNAPTTEPADG